MPSRRATLAGTALALAGCTTPGTSTESPAPPAISGSWTHADGDAAGSRSTSSEPLDAAPAAQWTVDLDTPSALLDVQQLYTADEARVVRRWLDDGTVAAERLFDPTPRPFAAVDDSLYLTTGENDPTLHALDSGSDGPPTNRWSKDGLRGRRATSEFVVATTNDNSRLVVLESDGSERWSVSPPELVEEAEQFGRVVVANGYVYAVAERDSTAWVTGLRVEDGHVAWLGQDANQDTVLAAGENIVVSAGAGAAVTGFSTDGNTLWELETDGTVQTAVTTAERVYLGTAGGVRGFTWQGDALWERSGARLLSADAGAVYVVDDGVRSLTAEDGNERWSLEADPDVLLPADGGLLTLGMDGARLALYR